MRTGVDALLIDLAAGFPVYDETRRRAGAAVSRFAMGNPIRPADPRNLLVRARSTTAGLNRCSEATRTQKHAFAQPFRCLCPLFPVSGIAKAASGQTPLLFWDVYEFFPGHEIDRSLTGPCEGKRPFVGTGGLRENAPPFQFCEVCSRMWSSRCRCAEGIRG